MAVVTMNSPRTRNALASDEQYGAIEEVCARLSRDRAIRAAVWTGAGPAFCAGLDLACMCDIRIAASSAKFAESFVRLGIIPGDGGAFLLQRLVGPSKAAELTFTGETIDAQQALACGLVSQVAPDGQLMEHALALAHRIAQNAPHALRMAKRLLRESQLARLETVLELSASFQALAHATSDHAQRIQSAVGSEIELL